MFTRSQTAFNPEMLRQPENIWEPDPRSNMFVRLDQAAGTIRYVELADHHADISALSLHEGVPKDIVVQFEVARNLYLYAWFVYRFYPVAEQHSLSCLEFALRHRFKDEIHAGKVAGRRKKPMLRSLLKHAIDKGLVKNEGFERWRRSREINLRNRFEDEKSQEMLDNDSKRISWSESEIEVTPAAFDWDFVSMLVEFLPYVRNDYAHGSTTLHNLALSTIQVVREIINQLYARPSELKKT